MYQKGKKFTFNVLVSKLTSLHFNITARFYAYKQKAKSVATITDWFLVYLTYSNYVVTHSL